MTPVLAAGRVHGRNADPNSREAGVTLLEMLIVVALMALLIGITFPSVGAGLESLRLRSASEDIVGELNSALTRANRRQDAVQVVISPARRSVLTQAVHSAAPRTVTLPDGIRIARVLPDSGESADDAGNSPDRDFFIYPDGSVPSIVIDLVNNRGFHRLVSVDPITGVAREQSVANGMVEQSQ
ncbi:MAG TPA: prepilin-type N-terminal cleavage/methylation domain-containing protein [Bryobacteraceae bacterium]|nr:prepilin-type N-terminal cleavage/methylation domain-containing protein [Bryobacteraceae bacterium]